MCHMRLYSTDKLLMPYNELYRGQGYLMNVSAYSTSGNIISTTDYADPVNVMVQFEICQNITKPVNPACNVTAPAYMVRSVYCNTN